MERHRHIPEKESKKLRSSTLIKSGSVVSGLGTITILEDLATQHGELGSLSLLITGCGVSLILTGVRKEKIKHIENLSKLCNYIFHGRRKTY